MFTKISSTTALAIICALVLGCPPAAPPHEEVAQLESRLAALVEAAVGDGSVVRGAALAVESPKLRISWSGAAGMADPEGGVAMTAATPVRLASNTKTYVAAAVLRLVEDGRLGLDQAVGELLPEEAATLLAGDGHDLQAMRLRHLLTHTSGLFDHTSSPRYEEAILADPQHRWTALEQVARAVEWGNPHGAPGEIYTYCDTGYVLLGLILEQATGQGIAGAARELVGFDRLGLASTWWETLEPAPAGVPERAHQFLGELDTFDFDPSLDLYGGGGLVAPVTDLARFTRALFTGEVFARPDTLEIMLAPVEGARALPDASPRALAPGAYRMGIWRVEVDGLEGWRHSGFWGTSATWIPELDLVVAATVNQNQGGTALDDMVREAIIAARSWSSDSLRE